MTETQIANKWPCMRRVLDAPTGWAGVLVTREPRGHLRPWGIMRTMPMDVPKVRRGTREVVCRVWCRAYSAWCWEQGRSLPDGSQPQPPPRRVTFGERLQRFSDWLNRTF